MGFLSFLLPSDSKFFGLFEDISENLRKAGKIIHEHAKKEATTSWSDVAAAVKDLEHANDIYTHKIFNELHNSFITPFDREDIHQLTSCLDDILDYATYSLQRAAIYEVGAITPAMVKQLECLVLSIYSVCDIIDRLRDLKNIGEIQPYLMEVHRLENLGDMAYMEALAQLFTGGHDAVSIIKWKDIHHLVETAVDRCERVADVAEGIAIKHA